MTGKDKKAKLLQAIRGNEDLIRQARKWLETSDVKESFKAKKHSMSLREAEGRLLMARLAIYDAHDVAFEVIDVFDE